MLTVPRSVSIKEGRLYQEPVVNCREAYKAAACDKIEDKIQKGVVTIKVTNLESFAIKMRSNGVNYTQMTLEAGQWVFDRSKSGETITGAEKDMDSQNGIRRMPCSNKKEMTVTIVMDDFSVEIFEDGRALTSTIYPPEDADGLELIVKAENWQYDRADIILKET
jgi:sucrose-6-phosphate hydrolase SacC (GH32 family)